MRKMLFITLLMGGLCTTVSVAKAQERLPEYLQAEKYTQEKLNFYRVYKKQTYTKFFI